MPQLLPMNTSDTYSVAEAAEMLGVAENTLRASIAAGEFSPEPIRIGRAIRIPKAPLDRKLGKEVPA